jgi:hypothetical protein
LRINHNLLDLPFALRVLVQMNARGKAKQMTVLISVSETSERKYFVVVTLFREVQSIEAHGVPYRISSEELTESSVNVVECQKWLPKTLLAVWYEVRTLI